MHVLQSKGYNCQIIQYLKLNFILGTSVTYDVTLSSSGTLISSKNNETGIVYKAMSNVKDINSASLTLLTKMVHCIPKLFYSEKLQIKLSHCKELSENKFELYNNKKNYIM